MTRAFEHVNPTSVEGAISYLGGGRDEAVVIAGGTDLITEMKDRIAIPGRVVNLKGLKDLQGIERKTVPGAAGDRVRIRIGALVKLAALEGLGGDGDLAGRFTAITEAAAAAASPQIRNQGTLGGNLCQRPRCPYYRDPELFCMKRGGLICYAEKGDNRYHSIFGGGPPYIVHPSDLAPALIAFDAEVTLRSPEGERRLPLDAFFILPEEDATRENVLGPKEILVAVEIAEPEGGARSSYVKATQRGSWDFALVSCAVVLGLDADGVCSMARIVMGGVAPRPWRVPGAEEALTGKKISEEVAAAAAGAALEGARPLGRNGYKVPLGRAIVKRAILQAADRP